MLLKLLDHLGRKKTVLDRGPSHPEYDKAKPWMERYYLLFRRRPKWFPFNILIHKMLDDDHGDGVHNHMCPYITVILTGKRLRRESFGDVQDILDFVRQIIYIE